jgi:hypothetical protein
VLLLSPPVSGDAGHVSLIWLILFFGVLADSGRIFFGTYMVAAEAGIFMHSRRRKV